MVPLSSYRRALIAAAAASAAATAWGCGRRATVAEAELSQPSDQPPPAAEAAPQVARPTRSKAPKPARLSFEVRDVASGALIPTKITLVGAAGTPDPDLAWGDTPRREPGLVAAHNYAVSLSGQGTLEVPQGTYDIHASRGPEWALFTARGVTIGESGASFRATLAHVVDTRGWYSADFHVHAAPSYDSRVPLEARVLQFAADGVDMIVGADHGVITDYAPVIAELGAGAYLASAMGQEITTEGEGPEAWGHFGAFPLPLQRGAHGGGAIAPKGRAPAAFFRDVRARSPGALLSAFHPRFNWGMGYFNLAHFDPAADRAGRAGFSFDFDAVEVLNGLEAENHESVEAVLADWFALLRHGHMVAATGNSDTHHLDRNLGGYPRNYVRVPRDVPGAVRPLEVARGVKALRSFLTTAPFVRLSVGGAGLGDVAPAPGGKVHGEVSVQAAPWVSLSTVTLYLDGVEVRRWRVPEGQAVDRFSAGFDLKLERDGFVVARVEGDRPLFPVIGGTAKFRVRPFALTNPVLIDVNGDRRYSAAERHGAH